jgi:hypothetical protein
MIDDELVQRMGATVRAASAAHLVAARDASCARARERQESLNG